MNVLKYISKSYKGDKRTYFDEDADDIVGSCRLLLVAHGASGFDGWVVLISLIKETTEIKISRTARGLISLSFRCRVKIMNRVELPET